MADDTPESQPGGARSPEERPTPVQAGRGEGGDLPRLSRLLASLAAFCHRRAPLVLALALALVGASYFGAKRLSLDTDLTKLLPRSFESVRNLDVLAERAFGVGYVTVVASGSEREELERFARDFAPKLEALPSIQYVDYRRPIDFFRDHALYYLELEDLESLRDQLADRYLWEVRKRSPMHDLDLEELGEAPEIDLESLKKKQEGRAGGAGLSLDSDPYLIDPDGKMIVLLARPALRASDVGKAGEVVEEVRRLVDAEDTTPYGGLKLELSGRFQKKADQKRQIEHDLSLSSTLALGLMILYLALHFRRATAVVAVLVPLVVGLAWTFGFAGIAIGRLNLLTGFIGAILLGIGIDHGIHLVGRYHEELARGEPRDTALRLTFADSGRAALLAAATTVFAFVGVAMSEFRAFREFGILAGVGSSLILVAYATVLPALLTYLGAPKKAAEKPKEKGADDQEAPSAIARLLPRWAPVGFWISALLAVWAMTFLDRTRFDYDFASLEDSRLPSFKLDKEVNRLLGRSQTPLLALGDNPEQEVAIAKALRERQKELGDASGIQMVVALGDLVPPKQTEKAAVLAEMRETLESIKPEWLDEEKAKGRADLLRMTQQKPFGRDGLPVEITRQFRGAASESGFVLIYPSISLSDGRGVRKLADELAAVRLDGGEKPIIVGEALVTADVLDMVFTESPTVLALTALLVAVALALALQKLWMAGSAMLVATVTLLVTAGLMPLFGVPFNYLNVVMLPVLFGIGVDGSVHVVTRIDGGASVPEVVRETGRSITGAILTTVLGFGALLLADHPGLRSLGAVAVIGLTTNLAVGLVLLPSLLALREVSPPPPPRAWWATLGATVGKAGLSPKAPGTMGALAALPLALVFRVLPVAPRIGVLVALTAVSHWVTARYLRDDPRTDPQEIVVDELAGCAIAIAVVPGEPLWVLVGFVLFRLFDILKPGPIRWLGDRHGAFGVMADDIAAGLVSAAIIAGVYYGVLNHPGMAGVTP